MTNQEAINVMEKYTDECVSRVVSRAHILAIAALYKQVPKEPIKEWDRTKGDMSYYRYVCRECENVLRPGGTYKYCPYCGQKLKWEDQP